MNDRITLRNLRRLNVRHGDLFVMQTEAQIDDKMTKRIKMLWRSLWGKRAPKLIVLGYGFKIGVIRKEHVQKNFARRLNRHASDTAE